MIITLYMPYYDYNDGAFDVNNDYYSEEEYMKAVSDEYNKNKDIVYDSVMGVKNGTGSLISATDGQTYKFGQKTSQKQDKVSYSKCEAVLWDSSGDEETVDGFIEKFARQKRFVCMVELNGDTSEEEFETEMSLWVREHNKINSYKDELGEDWVLSNEPKRELKLQFKNNADQDVYGVLENCRIMDIGEGNLLMLLVERITLVDEI